MHMPSYSHAGYLENIIQVEKLRVLIPKVIKALEKYDFDTLAFRGMSGTLIGPSVALAMEKTMILVRKPGVDCHSYRIVEGDYAAKRYIIIDDMVSTGNTAKAIIEEIKSFAPMAECLGVIEVNNIMRCMYPEDEKLKIECIDYSVSPAGVCPLTYKPKTKENTCEKAVDQESPKASKAPVSSRQAFYPSLLPEGLRGPASGWQTS